MSENFDVAIVGCGNMGAALLSGYLSRFPEAHILVVDPDIERARSLVPKGEGLVFASGLSPLAKAMAALTILAVKPQSCSALLPELADTTAAQGLVLSIVAGVPSSTFQDALPAARIVRCMPNTPALCGEGASVLWCNAQMSAADRSLCRVFFEAAGSVDWVDQESHIDLVTAVSGSGPAYFFALTEALSRAGAAIGLAPDLAAKLARRTAIGAAAMMRGAETPQRLKEAVRSPAGTTDAALRVFEYDGGFDGLVHRAVTAARMRAAELSLAAAQEDRQPPPLGPTSLR